MDDVERAIVTEEYEALAVSIWTPRLLPELEHRHIIESKQREDIESLDSAQSQGRRVLDLILNSTKQNVFKTFCDCILASECGESLAEELKDKVKWRRKTPKATTPLRTEESFQPKESFPDVLKQIENALDGVMDLGDLKLFSVTLTSNTEKTGGLPPLEQEKVDACSSAVEVFDLLRPYLSWSDCSILEKLIDISNCPKAQLLINSYIKGRQKYLGEEAPERTTRYNAFREFILDRLSVEHRKANVKYEVMRSDIRSDANLLTAAQMAKMKRVLSEVFDLPENQIRFGGRIESEIESLLWLVPEEEINRILPLAYTHRSQLKKVDIQRLEVGRYLSYHVREDFTYNDTKAPSELQQFRERISKVQEMATDEWSLIQEVNGLLVEPGVSLLDPCYLDYKKNMDFILGVQLDKVPLPPENEYSNENKPGPDIIYTNQWPEYMWRCGRYLQFKNESKVPFPMHKVTVVEIGELIWCVPGWTSNPKDKEKIIAFDYKCKKWLPPIKCPHYHVGATAIGGKLVIVGGITFAAKAVTNRILLLNQARPTSTAYEWETSESLPPMPTKRYMVGVITWETYIIVAGGRAENLETVLDIVEVMEIAHHSPPQWYRVTSLPLPLWGISMVTMGHRLYLSGSASGYQNRNKGVYSACIIDLVHSFFSKKVTVELEDLSKGSCEANCEKLQIWRRLVDPGCFEPTLVVFNQRVCAIGGIDSYRFRASTSSFAYNIRQNSWRRISGMNTARAEHAAIALPSRRLLVIGGWKGDYCPIEDIEIGFFEEY